MITICPNGGLGNQLFHYAAGRALAVHHDVELEIDTWHFGALPEAGPRPLQLHKLDLPARWRFYRPKGLHAPDGLPQRAYRRLVRPLFRKTVVEDAVLTSENFFSMPPNSLLFGYFQSLRFFAPIADRLRGEINLKKIATPDALSFGERLKGRPYCAIQIRRGDYVKNPLFDVIDWWTYLPAAIGRMTELAKDIRFVVFSDDPAWCRDLVLLKNAIIHQPAPGAVADAMYLMSQCSHHIISNSSYGWWGAFLANSNRKGCVVAPSQWLLGRPTMDAGLCAAGWHLL